MAARKQTVTVVLIRFVFLGLLLLLLWNRFPDHRVATTVIGVAFAFEQLVNDPLLRLLPWSILGSVAAYYSMHLAFSLDQTLHTSPASTMLEVAFGVVRSIATLGSLIFLIGRLPIGSRAFAFVTFLSFAFGSLAYYAGLRCNEWRQDFYYEYSFPSIGCAVGTILGIVLLIWRRTFLKSSLD